MSRIGKNPILIPSGVTITIDENLVTVKGPKGQLTLQVRSEMGLQLEGNTLVVMPNGETRLHRSLHGLTRTLIDNMVIGVSVGFSKNLELVGVGYRAAATSSMLTLQLGYSHPVEIVLPEGIEAKVEANTKLSISGIDKQAVGDIAALVRSKRPPEPYKGKGVRYANEVVRRKAGKSGKK
ncbi:MAG: 50S ribosomal protein L6 [Vampirovibrio sp.]